MKLLLKKFFLSPAGIIIRNTLNFNPVDIVTQHIKNASVSDAFAWRTDKGFKTIFKFSDLMKLYYKYENTVIKIEFYDKKNNFLKSIKIKCLKLSNKLVIDKEFLNGIEDYGVFYVYHKTNKSIPNEDSISNKCYLGYSLNKNFFSFVHGNCLSRYKSLNNAKYTKKYSPVKMSLRNNQLYKIQKLFKQYDRNELLFCNPTESKITFDLNNKKYILENGSSLIIDYNNLETVIIKSNCMFLRPTIFSYKKQYFDVHHS